MLLDVEAALYGNLTYRSNHRLIRDSQESQGNLFNSPTWLPSGCRFIVDLIGQGLVYVGHSEDVAILSKWKQARPLLGRNLLITRAEDQQASLFNELTNLGAHVAKLSLTRLSVINGPKQTLMYDNLADYQWLLFTSVNAVTFFFKGLESGGYPRTSLIGVRIACIGPTTKACLESYGCEANLIPRTFTSEGLLDAFSKIPMNRLKVLLPRAEVARENLPDGLRNLGAQLDVVPIYKKELVDTELDTWNTLNVRAMDGVLFCASSAVQAMEKWINESNMGELRTTVQVFCIGPSTAATASQLGYTRIKVASEQTIDGLVDSIVNFNFE